MWKTACIAVTIWAVAASGRSTTEVDWRALAELQGARNWSSADSLAAHYLTALEAEGVPDSSAFARLLLHRASIAWERRSHGESGVVDALERSIAIQRRHDPPGGARLPWSHVLAARVLQDLAQAEPALHHAREASRLYAAMDHPDSVQWAEAELYVGTTSAALGREAQAREGYRRSLELREARSGADSPALVPALAEYAMLLTEQGRFDEARPLLERAEHLSERIESPFSTYLIETLARRSTLESRAGNLAESIEFADRAARSSAERWGADSAEFARARVRLAYRLEEFGDYAGEARILHEAVPVLDSTLGVAHPHTLNARLALIEASLETGDTTTVAVELPVARSALERGAPTADRTPLYGLLLESRLARSRGDRSSARAHAERALALEVVDADATGRAAVNAIGTLLQACAGDADRRIVNAAGARLDSLASAAPVVGTRDWIETAIARGRAEARVGMRDRAWQTALAAESRAIEWFGYEVRALPDTRALQLSSRVGEAAELLVALARTDDAEEITTAWDRTMRWRGLVAQEMGRRRPVAFDGDPSRRALHAQWIASQRELARQVVAGSMRPTDPDQVARFESARSAAETAERAYVRASGDDAGASEVTFERVRAALAAHQALVAFVRGDVGDGNPILRAFVLRGDDPDPLCIDLGSMASVDEHVARWRSAIVSVAVPRARPVDAAITRRLGADVRTSVWDPLSAVIGDAREVLIVPEGAVTELPWLALPVGRDRHLAEGDVIVRVLNSERDLLRSREDSPRASLLAVGGPDFDDAGAGSVRRDFEVALRTAPCVGAAAIVLDDLPSARLEATSIAESWSREHGASELLLGSEATESRIKEAMPGRTVVHLATHGVVVEDGCAAGVPGTRGVGGVSTLAADSEPAPARSASPWIGRRVWLALAGANHAAAAGRDENEGLLTAEEIVTLDLRGTEWVVLSACDTGRGEAWAREGLLGLRRAFHLAGARAVIASQWAVADDDAREWMGALYRARERGLSAGAAVQAACREVLAARRQDGRSTAPFHWATFVATGE